MSPGAGRPDRVRRDMAAAEALELALRQGGAAHEAARQAILSRDEPEDVHAARVALRRMRSILRGFGDMVASKTGARLDDLLAERCRALAALRDADVQAEAATGASRAEAAARAQRLRAEARAMLADPQDHPPLPGLIAATTGDRARLCKGNRRRRLAAAPVALIAARGLQTAWSELLSFGPQPEALPPEERHQFRKRAKDLRYIAEFFAPLFDGRQPRAMLKTIKALQDALGTLNDLHVMAADAALPDDAAAREAKARDKARKLWKRLRASPVWWLDVAA
ncbi:CHAD domain-containing protein [Paracoccus spongiarum]|uniref:CHAD domain-containing protein n=1 Tax=Paracoccus spongiarum TaxID=3064387 RepID=A0ABT9JD43_9RHOB|nr:CHAD domain-containing protein [Paracoccus sp. 2205BS29-5]MDP5307752.1 CHAD domain-containing protein [Paracoccus sp. 2205BS29-5]